MTTIYVTKYALTEGPFKVDAEISHSGSMASFRVGNSYMRHVHGKDFWLTREEALADCERRRTNKLASIEKQKVKLQKLQFTIDGE